MYTACTRVRLWGANALALRVGEWREDGDTLQERGGRVEGGLVGCHQDGAERGLVERPATARRPADDGRGACTRMASRDPHTSLSRRSEVGGSEVGGSE